MQTVEVERLREQVLALKPQVAELDAVRTAQGHALAAAEEQAREISTLQQRVAEFVFCNRCFIVFWFSCR